MLRACRRVLRPGGRLAFHTIEPVAGLAGADRRRAHRLGPPAVAVRTSYRSLLSSAGFVDVDSVDITAAYRHTQQAWKEATERRADELSDLIGADAYCERVSAQTTNLAGIEDGLLARVEYVARRA